MKRSFRELLLSLLYPPIDMDKVIGRVHVYKHDVVVSRAYLLTLVFFAMAAGFGIALCAVILFPHIIP